ncbi:FGGY-family carbohydrate kinase [Pseudooctadecabacter jejudonensis]|uniref:Xylulose kinase n=1 Tax=Pseudooctadecabacter jejudonensis TaxID=1391910 RepID=A0A1Y5SHW3_9RHOB|nr:FGGY-family carbohydrate kinase [Pseudooctadecabacter jejudonensis]SLN41210.1 Xylulose kinase [Pseudooctadecabacter jejudonensis]
MSLSLGIDIGTSGIRTAVIDDAGTVVSMARAAHLPQDPDRIDAEHWWTAVRTCLVTQVARLRAAGQSPADIAAIAVDGTSGTMVLTDANLAPVTRALMYNSKGFEAEAARIAEHAPPTHITRGSSSALARAMRLRSEDTDNRAAHLLHQADFIAAKLMGVGCGSDHNNALKTGFDPETGRWPDWIGAVFPTNLLPDPAPVGALFGSIDPALATSLGLSPTTHIHAGTTDSIAAFLAASPVRAGHAVTSIGSTLAIKLLSTQRIDAPEIGLYSHRLGDQWLIGGASNTGGAVLAHFFTPDDLERLTPQIRTDRPTGLDYYPLIKAGERFPVNDPDLQPCLSPRPDDDVVFLQGLLEGIADIEARCYAEIAARGGGDPVHIFSAGGAAKNTALLQMRQARLPASVSVTEDTEAAIGAARCTMLTGSSGP